MPSLGQPVYVDDRRILTFARLLGLPEGAQRTPNLRKEPLSASMRWPGSRSRGFMGELVAFLEDMSRDPIDGFFGGRATRILFRIAEHKELVEAHAQDQYDPE